MISAGPPDVRTSYLEERRARRERHISRATANYPELAQELGFQGLQDLGELTLTYEEERARRLLPTRRRMATSSKRVTGALPVVGLDEGI